MWHAIDSVHVGAFVDLYAVFAGAVAPDGGHSAAAVYAGEDGGTGWPSRGRGRCDGTAAPRRAQFPTRLQPFITVWSRLQPVIRAAGRAAGRPSPALTATCKFT